MFSCTSDNFFDLPTHFRHFQIGQFVTFSKKFPLYINFTIKVSIEKIVKNYFLGSPMCPLQITNDIEPLSLTLHALNGCFIR